MKFLRNEEHRTWNLLMKIDPKATKLERVLRHERQLACCAYSPDGGLLYAAGYDGVLHRWALDGNPQKASDKPSPKTKQKPALIYNDRHDSFPANGGWIESLVLHPDGKRFFTAGSWGEVHCWPIGAGKLMPRWSVKEVHASWLRRLAVSPRGDWLATCGNDCMVRVFSTASGKLVRELKGHEHPVMSVAFHGDGGSLASGDLLGGVKHWDLASGKCQRSLDAGKLYKKYQQYDQGGVRAMTFDSAGKTLYCAGFEGTNANQAQGHPTIVALDWASGKQQVIMTTRTSFAGPIVDVAYHPAGYLIGAGSSEAGGALWFWKPGQEKDEHMVKYVNSFRGLGLHSDGLRLAVAAFGDRGGQRGGNGRRLNAKNEYPDFGGSIVLYSLG
jgi:WD40 repeat protein